MSCSLLAAIAFAADAHRGQLRADGTPYMDHPVAVLHVLWHASLDLPLAASLAAVLHDVLEDTSATECDLRMLAGDEVAIAVGLLTRAPGQPEDAYLRRMCGKAHAYPYVPLIKMADRIHNLLTAGALTAEKRSALADETLGIHAPIFRQHRPMSEPYASTHDCLLAWMERLATAPLPRAEGNSMQEITVWENNKDRMPARIAAAA